MTSAFVALLNVVPIALALGARPAGYLAMIGFPLIASNRFPWWAGANKARAPPASASRD